MPFSLSMFVGGKGVLISCHNIKASLGEAILGMYEPTNRNFSPSYILRFAELA
jgi:hypothetical protein